MGRTVGDKRLIKPFCKETHLFIKTNPFNITSANRVISGPTSGFIEAKFQFKCAMGLDKKNITGRL